MPRIILISSYHPPIKEFASTTNPCFVARGVNWLRSFVAIDGTRSVCEMEAPYAEVVRDACRQGGLDYDRVWRADICCEQDWSAESASSSFIVAEVEHELSLPADWWSASQESLRPDLQEQSIQPIHALISQDGRHSISIFAAASVDAVQQAYHHAGIHPTHLWRSYLVLPTPAYPKQQAL